MVKSTGDIYGQVFVIICGGEYMVLLFYGQNVKQSQYDLFKAVFFYGQ